LTAAASAHAMCAVLGAEAKTMDEYDYDFAQLILWITFILIVLVIYFAIAFAMLKFE